MKTRLLAFLLLWGVTIASSQSQGTFVVTGSMDQGRIWHTATLLNDGRVLVAGGFVPNNSSLADAELYDPSTGAFASAGKMTSRRAFHTATLLPDGTVLITGGNSGFEPVATAEIYDPESGLFTPVQDMATRRAAHTATLLNNGKVLIVGSSPGSEGLTAELYDPGTRSFNRTGNTTAAHWSHRATLLASGKVLILPGGDASDYENAELYDPVSGTFRATGWVTDVSAGGVAHTASLIPNGKVLVTLAVPECDYPGASAQLYDPATETFSATGSMVTERCYEAATSLSNGIVLVSGNWLCTGFDTAESYNPGSAAFSPEANMIFSRFYHTATMLRDGRVLMAGGQGSDPNSCGRSPLTSAELYTPLSAGPPPVLLSVSNTSQGAILHASTHQVVSPSNPAAFGEPLEIYVTGLIDNAVIPPQVSIGGVLAEVLYFGNAPGYAGLNQINVRVPTGIAAGPSVLVHLNYFGRPSNSVTIGIQ